MSSASTHRPRNSAADIRGISRDTHARSTTLFCTVTVCVRVCVIRCRNPMGVCTCVIVASRTPKWIRSGLSVFSFGGRLADWLAGWWLVLGAHQQRDDCVYSFRTTRNARTCTRRRFAVASAVTHNNQRQAHSNMHARTHTRSAPS